MAEAKMCDRCGAFYVKNKTPRGEDEGFLIFGRKFPNYSVEIINAFQGEEAWWIYHNLVTKKEKKENA